MRNTEYGVRSSTSSTASGPPSPRWEGFKAEVEEIASEQVVFPDRKTADIVVKELWEAVESLRKNVEELKNKITE